jgi:glycosyltransferase involved in cell wall biosynthesis
VKTPVKRQPQSRVCIIYPADPLGVIPGGIDSFIKGVLRWAPRDIDFTLLGITTDRKARPPGQWTSCSVNGRRRFGFYPVLALDNPEKQATVPVVLRFLFAVLQRRVDLTADILEFHRVEPCLAFFRDSRPKTLVMHQNMHDLRNLSSDIRWRHFPSLYFKLEDNLLPRMSSIFCVREDAAAGYRERYPSLRNRIHFTPTWMDPETFHLPDDATRRQGRTLLTRKFGFTEEDFVLVTVGRLDRQKNPLLLLDAFRLLQHSMPDLRLMFIGDGVLRRQVEQRIARHGLEEKVRMCGVQPASSIATHLQASDLFVLSSAYEGMPIVVLEALGSGLPVVATDVGEVSRVVQPGVNGELVSVQDAESLANAIRTGRESIGRYRGRPCRDAVQPYMPQQVLMPIYDNYRRLAARDGVPAAAR